MIGKQVLAFSKSEKSEFINIGIFAASSGGRKGRRHIRRFTPDRERSHVCCQRILEVLQKTKVDRMCFSLNSVFLIDKKMMTVQRKKMRTDFFFLSFFFFFFFFLAHLSQRLIGELIV